MIIPVVPSFSEGACSIASLASLSAAVSTISNTEYVPQWRFITNANQGIAASTYTVVQFNTVEYDSDSVFDSTIYGAQINTQGYYEVESCVEFAQASSNSVFFLQFWVTIGGSNPDYASGTQLAFGQSGGSLPGGSTIDYTFCLTDMCPYCLYPNDQVQVRAYCTVATTLAHLTNASGVPNGWFACQFSGRWIREGS